MFLKKLLLLVLALPLMFASIAGAAAGDVSVDIQTPKSSTKDNSFTINFVALDIQDRAITVKCFKKGPTDGGFSQFGSDIVLTAGGNTDYCDVTNAVVSQQGTYQFYVTATANGDTATSAIVSVDYNTDGPGTPTDYQKHIVTSCQYRIHFKTADDGGKTVKVEVYRSENTSFTADAGTRVATVGVGSNETRDVLNDKADCSKDYYFVVRAFDSAGNGSGIVGDNETTVTTTTTTTTASPAPAVAAGTPTGTVLGEEEGATDEETEIGLELSEDMLPEDLDLTTEEGEVLGVTTSPWIWVLGGAVLLLIIWYVFKKFFRPQI
jgi:hypothetical protein